MSRYEKTYHRYGELMLCLHDELCKLNAVMPTSYSSQKTSCLLDIVDETILTARMMRNVPSPELYSITCKMAELYVSNSDAGMSQSFNWKHCFRLLLQSAEQLKEITDDTYVNNAYSQLKILSN